MRLNMSDNPCTFSNNALLYLFASTLKPEIGFKNEHELYQTSIHDLQDDKIEYVREQWIQLLKNQAYEHANKMLLDQTAQGRIKANSQGEFLSESGKTKLKLHIENGGLQNVIDVRMKAFSEGLTLEKI